MGLNVLIFENARNYPSRPILREGVWNLLKIALWYLVLFYERQLILLERTCNLESEGLI